MANATGTFSGTGNYPSASGVTVTGKFWFEVMNGTTVTGTLQFLTSDGATWKEVPDDNSLQNISGATLRQVEAPPAMKVRINITAVTGTWNYKIHDYNDYR